MSDPAFGRKSYGTFHASIHLYILYTCCHFVHVVHFGTPTDIFNDRHYILQVGGRICKLLFLKAPIDVLTCRLVP